MTTKRTRSTLSNDTESDMDSSMSEHVPKRQRVTRKVNINKRPRLTRQQLRARLKQPAGPGEEIIEILDNSEDSDATIIMDIGDLSFKDKTAHESNVNEPNGIEHNQLCEEVNVPDTVPSRQTRLSSKRKATNFNKGKVAIIEPNAHIVSQQKVYVSSRGKAKDKGVADIMPPKVKIASKAKVFPSIRGKAVNTRNMQIIKPEQMIASKQKSSTSNRAKTVYKRNMQIIHPERLSASQQKTPTSTTATKDNSSSKCNPSAIQPKFKEVSKVKDSRRSKISTPTTSNVEIIDLCASDDETTPNSTQASTKSSHKTDSTQPIIYENGIPVKINPNLDRSKLDARMKRLLDQKRPMMKQVAELGDVSQFHYVMTDHQGNISKDNDSIAQFIIDIGIMVKTAGKKLIDDGMKLQHEISTMRQHEEIQLKQEIPSDELDSTQEGENLSGDIKEDFLNNQKITASVSKFKSVRIRSNRKPQTAEEKLKRKFVCQICGDSFTNQENLDTHLNRHKNLLIVCTDCGRLFYSKERHRKHKQAHINGFLQCNWCPESFDTIKALRAHVARHGCQRFVCYLEGCEQSYADKGNLINHVQYQHQNQRNVPCDLCPKYFKSPNVVRSHKYRDHK